jgi:hypothetical protein
LNVKTVLRIRDIFACVAIGLLLSAGCTSKNVSFEGIDLRQWRADHKACDGARMTSRDVFTAQKDKLLALSESDVVALLGGPDKQELSKRNQKFYYYYLEPAGECAVTNASVKPIRLAIRFNATGLAKEVRIEKDY